MQEQLVAGRYAVALRRTATAASPRETAATKKQLVEKAFGKRLAPTTRHFFSLLLDKKRHARRPLIAERSRAQADEVSGSPGEGPRTGAAAGPLETQGVGVRQGNEHQA